MCVSARTAATLTRMGVLDNQPRPEEETPQGPWDRPVRLHPSGGHPDAPTPPRPEVQWGCLRLGTRARESTAERSLLSPVPARVLAARVKVPARGTPGGQEGR